jgi:hypothetical protein
MDPEVRKIKKVVEKGLNDYQYNWALGQYICSIPNIGNALDYIFSESGKAFHKRRLHQTIQDLNEEMSQINESMIDH